MKSWVACARRGGVVDGRRGVPATRARTPPRAHGPRYARTDCDRCSTLPDLSSASTASTGGALGTAISVSKPATPAVPICVSWWAAAPPRIPQCETSVAPFQLTWSWTCLPLRCAATLGDAAGVAFQTSRNAREDGVPGGGG